MSIIDIGITDAVIATMIVFFLKHIATKLFEARENNKRFDTWMEFLRSDDGINECVGVFEQITSQETWPKFNTRLNIFGISLPIIVFAVMYIFYENSLKYFVYLSWIYIIIPILSSIILSIAINKINEKKLLIEIRMTGIWILTAKFFTLNSVLVIALILLFVPFQESQTSSAVKIIEETVNILIVVFVGSMVFIEIIHRDFLGKVKTLLNTQHMANYPFIHITTKEAYLEGKMQDVFNSDLLILEDNGKKTIVEWNEITTMKLKEASLIDNSPPPSSQENP